MRILIAYDGFPHSQFALEEAAKLAGETGAKVTIVSVVPPEARATRTGTHVGLKPHAHEDVAIAHAFLRERGVESEMKIAYGEPADEIALEAEQGGYDMIVVGSRGLGRLGAAVLGSVSAELARKAPCPVLIAGEKAGTAATV
jgi:nucleotide-binding universal stress UspA family protein